MAGHVENKMAHPSRLVLHTQYEKDDDDDDDDVYNTVRRIDVPDAMYIYI